MERSKREARSPGSDMPGLRRMDAGGVSAAAPVSGRLGIHISADALRAQSALTMLPFIIGMA
jgi:hypothetical protein